MKINHKEHDKVPGIYCITNTSNGKVYIGKSVNIGIRIMVHKCDLRARDSRKENSHFINAWHKYGENCFSYSILEIIQLDQENVEEIFREKELYWMDIYMSYISNKGYNKRRDSATKMIVHEETRKKISEAVKGTKNPNYGNHWTDKMREDMSILKKEGLKSGKYKRPSKEQGLKAVAARNKLWEQFPEMRLLAIEKSRKAITIYDILQYTKSGELVKIWESITDIMREHPEYKQHNIYAVCSGEKPSMYGYKWVKRLKTNDIVQPMLKDIGEICTISKRDK